MMHAVSVTAAARDDVQDASDWYERKADDETATRFINAFADALGRLAKFPLIGSEA